MSSKEWKELEEELLLFEKNLKKDSIERRSDVEVVNRKVGTANKLGNKFNALKKEFNSKVHEAVLVHEVKAYVERIDKIIVNVRTILDDRLQSCSNKSEIESKISKMDEKFDLRTASSLLPVMDGTEIVTKRLIEAIELYDSLLDEQGKVLLTTYVLKARLTPSAKIRLKTEYRSNADLVRDISAYCLTKQSASSLSHKLNNARQGGKSIDEFGKEVEDLLVNLTISQADGNVEAMQILTNVNEKIAINAFATGLHNSELRTIIKARNYPSLGEAIRGAKDEEPSKSSQIFHIRGRGNFRSTNRGHFRGHFNQRPNAQSNRTQYSNNNRGRNNNYYNNSRGRSQNQTVRGYSSNRRGNSNGFQSRSYNYRSNGSVYTVSAEHNQSDQQPLTSTDDRFFRA